MIWIFVSPQNAYVEILTPKDDYILVGGVIGRWLGHEDQALINEISVQIGLSLMRLVLSKSILQNPYPLPPCEDTAGMYLLLTRNQALT